MLCKEQGITVLVRGQTLACVLYTSIPSKRDTEYLTPGASSPTYLSSLWTNDLGCHNASISDGELTGSSDHD